MYFCSLSLFLCPSSGLCFEFLQTRIYRRSVQCAFIWMCVHFVASGCRQSKRLSKSFLQLDWHSTTMNLVENGSILVVCVVAVRMLAVGSMQKSLSGKNSNWTKRYSNLVNCFPFLPVESIYFNICFASVKWHLHQWSAGSANAIADVHRSWMFVLFVFMDDKSRVFLEFKLWKEIRSRNKWISLFAVHSLIAIGNILMKQKHKKKRKNIRRKKCDRWAWIFKIGITAVFTKWLISRATELYAFWQLLFFCCTQRKPKGGIFI